jgi:rod shape-determining protein MreC
MLDIYSRHRSLTLLAGAVLVQLLLLAFQVKREHNVRLIRVWAAELVTPAERAGSWTLSKVSGTWTGYVALHGARVENARLRTENDQLRLRNQQLESQAAEARRLSVLWNFREAHAEAPMVAAQVIGASADPASHTLFINRGERDRVRRNLAVITPQGIVGKIVEVLPNSTSQVLLINDKDSGVGALFADSRTHGILKGSGDPQPVLDYVENGEKVQVGELVLTSGEDRIFPKGLLIGSVTDAKPGNPFQVIHIQPAVRLDRLEDVLVLLSQQELTPKKKDESAESAGADSGAPGIVQSLAPPTAAAPTPGNTGAPKASPPSASATKPPAPQAPSPR